jgi:hypothetical protein
MRVSICFGKVAKEVPALVELLVLQPTSFSCRVRKSTMAPSGKLKLTMSFGAALSFPRAMSWRVLLETLLSLCAKYARERGNPVEM